MSCRIQSQDTWLGSPTLTLEGFGASDDFGDFAGDACLAGTVDEERQRADHLGRAGTARKIGESSQISGVYPVEVGKR